MRPRERSSPPHAKTAPVERRIHNAAEEEKSDRLILDPSCKEEERKERRRTNVARRHHHRKTALRKSAEKRLRGINISRLHPEVEGMRGEQL